MEEPKYSFKSVDRASEAVLYKDKNSKFFGYVFPLTTDDQVKTYLEQLRKIHPKANHICYAWRLGTNGNHFRAYDDGEPRNTAGTPILGQLNAHSLTSVLVAVVRIFGGTKLGKGGLVLAYRTAAKMAIDASEIVERELEDHYLVSIEYGAFDRLMRIIKQEKWHFISQKSGTVCECILSVRKQDASRLRSLISDMAGAQLKRLT